MPITFQKCHAYNTVFFLNLNKLAFVSTPLLSCYLWSFLAFSKSRAVARQNGFHRKAYHCSSIIFPSGGFLKVL
jgi:hypothetical protein